jgi:hypothetical protein
MTSGHWDRQARDHTGKKPSSLGLASQLGDCREMTPSPLVRRTGQCRESAEGRAPDRCGPLVNWEKQICQP